MTSSSFTLPFCVLDGHEVKPATFTEWVAAELTRIRADVDPYSVGYDEVGDARISTVFLSVRGASGMAFETMIFEVSPTATRSAEVVERYATWDEAAAGHVAAVGQARARQGSYEDRVLYGIGGGRDLSDVLGEIKTSQRRHDPTDHDCRGGLPGDPYDL